MRLTLPTLLSVNAGYVDTAGFLALQGLFSAHVTGNFVTLGATLVLGTSGALAKMLALPVFCVVLVAARLLDTAFSNRRWPAFEALMGLHVILLILAAVLVIRLGPFQDMDGWPAVLSGMVLVSAMAIQNGFHRVHLPGTSPSTIMTGTTTQVMIDLADAIYAPRGVERRPASGLLQLSRSVLCFAAGCGAAALLYSHFGTKCFLVPPIMGGLQLMVRITDRSHT